jgi:hypothetical protein
MVHLERRRLVVQITMEFVIEVDQPRQDANISKPSQLLNDDGASYARVHIPSLLQVAFEVRCVTRHGKLHITP